MRIRTKRGYDSGEVSSAMQKAIRRADTRMAGYWALELWHSGFGNYVWKRLLTVSAEDVWGLITTEIKALHDSYVFVNKTVPAKQPPVSGPGTHNWFKARSHEFGLKLRAWRKARGLRQLDACAVLGLPRDQGLICRYERGEASPRRERMVSILAIIAGTEVQP